MADLVLFEFANQSDARAGRLAASLREAIRDAAPAAQVEVQRADPEAMDMGSIVALAAAVLGSGAAVAIAQGIGTWLAKHHGVKLKVKLPNGTEIEIIDATEAGVLKVLQAFESARSCP
jgi:hypothetical protein